MRLHVTLLNSSFLQRTDDSVRQTFDARAILQVLGFSYKFRKTYQVPVINLPRNVTFSNDGIGKTDFCNLRHLPEIHVK